MYFYINLCVIVIGETELCTSYLLSCSCDAVSPWVIQELIGLLC